MDEVSRDRVTSLWRKYFGDADLPLAVFYSNECARGPGAAPLTNPCVIGMLPLVADGKTLCLSCKTRMCGGARRYLGFSDQPDSPDFEYFLSYGIPGKLDGERYKKSPGLVRESMDRFRPFRAPKPFIVFKRWDKLSESDEPEVVVFLAEPDTIAGLFTLANYDEGEPDGVICPFGSGCSSIVYHPFMELRSSRPRCVLGMFDISARPYVRRNTLSFSAPFPKFRRMVDNMDESFLITASWKSLRRHCQSTGG